VVSVERARAPLLREWPGAAPAVLVSIRDSGAGIPKDDQERIFEKFGGIRGRRAGRSSTGLGLVFPEGGPGPWRLHRVESAVEVGSTFHILPRAQRRVIKKEEDKAPRARRAILPLPEDCAKVVLGDGRLTLAREPDGALDVLILDAFSGDAVPTHLLTRGALQLYLKKLTPHGKLLVHVTNTYVDLVPVLSDLASDAGLAACFRTYDDSEQNPLAWPMLVGRAVAPRR